MTPDDDAMGALGDDPRLADPLRALQNLGDGPAPAPSEKLAAFLADPSGGSSARAAGWGWVMKEKAARLSRAGKVLVIGGGIALAGAVSATAAWQVTAVLPSHDVDAPRHPAPISSPAGQHTTVDGHATPAPTAAPGDDSPEGHGQGSHGKDSSNASGSDKGKGDDGKDDADEGSGSGQHGDDGESGSGNGSGGGSDQGSGDDSGDHGSGGDSGDGSGSDDQGGHGSGDSGESDASPDSVD